jgi:CheY-like chemotaxis protein
MPRLDGIEAARRIRAGTGKSRNARIIAVTAHAMPDELDNFREAGIDQYLIKPVTRGSLARAMSAQATPGRSPASGIPASESGAAARPLIDDQQLFDLLGRLNDTTADNLLLRFMLEGEQIVGALTASPSAQDVPWLCHRLAGSASTFGAQRLASLLQAMVENQGDERALSALRSLLAEAWPATRAALADARPTLAVAS